MKVVRTITVSNEHGLHLRASNRFARTILEIGGTTVRVRHNGVVADGTAMLELMSLGTGPGCSIEVEAEGPQADRVVTALSALVADDFGL